MAKGYRPVRRDQPMLLPVDMHDWLPADHLVWFVLDTVDGLDTKALDEVGRRGGAGAARFDPRMLLALLVYAYCTGVRSSRAIERLCTTDVAFRVLCGQDVPDHCTIARFRSDQAGCFQDLFTQVLLIAANAGLARFGTVAIDGTKIAANASIDANPGQQWLSEQVEQIIVDAEKVDTAQDQGELVEVTDRVPASMAAPSDRRERIRVAAAQVSAELARRAAADTAATASAAARLQRSRAGQPVVGRIPQGPQHLAEAQAHLARETAIHQAKLDRYAGLVAQGRKPMGRRPGAMAQSSRVLRARRVVVTARARADQADAAQPGKAAADKLPSVVANTTDPQSRLMPTRKGFLQGYNAQLAVTSDHIVAAVSVGQSSTDQTSLVPMMKAAQAAADRCHDQTGSPDSRIGTVLADAGYASDANLAAPGPDRLIALSKRRDQARAAAERAAPKPPAPGSTPRQVMAHRLATRDGHAL